MRPTPDAELARRAEGVFGACTAIRVGIIAARPGNPLGAETRQYGQAWACRAPPFGDNLFNHAFGFSDDQLDAAAEVADWYAEKSVPGAFEIVPGLPSEKLMELLHARGYRQVRFHTRFIGPAELPQSLSPGVEVRRVETPADLAAFSDAYHKGWNRTDFRVPMEPWLTAPGWRLYLGLYEGQPAGAALLFLHDGDGYLADSAVDPAFRGHGVHRALLDRRCAEAAAEGCEVVFSGAEYAGASCRNMLRKGLTVLYTTSIWRVG